MCTLFKVLVEGSDRASFQTPVDSTVQSASGIESPDSAGNRFGERRKTRPDYFEDECLAGYGYDRWAVSCQWGRGQIDLIVRGICCLVPGESFSRNIRVTRIVDSFFGACPCVVLRKWSDPLVFIGSPDWMRRNLYRRIEAVTPILSTADSVGNDRHAGTSAVGQPEGMLGGQSVWNIFKRKPGNDDVRAVRFLWIFENKLAEN